GGLGQYIFRAVQSGDYPHMLAGSLLVTLLTLPTAVPFAPPHPPPAPAPDSEAPTGPEGGDPRGDRP
ncbi:hypothetical protein C5C27_00955, partial [Rathayibacter sp. AY2B7]